MPNNELQPCTKYVYTFRTRFDKDIAQKKEKPQDAGTKYWHLWLLKNLTVREE
jgi:hypothetical protein